MQFKYVVKRRVEKDSNTVKCTLKCGKLELVSFSINENESQTPAGKLKKDYSVSWGISMINVNFEALNGKRFKSPEAAIAAVEKLFDAKLSKLEAE